MAHAPLEIDRYSGSLREFFTNYVFPSMPSDEAVLAWDKSLTTYLDSSPPLFIVRRNRLYPLRGHIYRDKGHSFICSDNEPALWAYTECHLGKPALNFKRLIEKQMFPIAFCYKTAESKAASWGNTGRIHDDFSKGGWKHAHILACAKACEEEPLRVRMLRLLSPLNHFPFPSSRKFEMDKAWEESKEVLDIIVYMLAHSLGGEARRGAFQAFIKLGGGGAIPTVPPPDISIAFKRNLEKAKRFIDPHRLKDKPDLKNAPSTDESYYSLPSINKREAIPFRKFVSNLKLWIDNTDEETVCNGSSDYNQAKWLWTSYGTHLLYLNADSNRDGVKAFLAGWSNVKALAVIRNGDKRKKVAERKVNKVVIQARPEIPGFYLYTEHHFHEEQLLCPSPSASEDARRGPGSQRGGRANPR
jgi:hypothetical protein